MAARFGARNLPPIWLAAIGLLFVACGAASDDAGIFVMEVGSESARLVGEPAGVPVWSPTGAAIAWASEDGLAIVHLEDETTHQLSTRAVAGRPAWAPDGSAVAFVDGTAWSLSVVDAQSGQALFDTPVANPDARKPAHPLLTLGGPSWSPDGERIAFSCWDGDSDEICTIGADGEDRQQLTQIQHADNGPLSSGTEPRSVANTGPAAWSPDGRTIAVAVYPEQRGAPAGVFVIDIHRGRSRKLSSIQPNWEITWFPDGTAVVCSSTKDGRSDVYRISLGDGKAQNLTAELATGARYPALGADGSRLAVTTRNGITIVNLGDGSIVPIDTPQAAKYPAWNSDGSAVAYSVADDPIRWYE